MVCLLCVVKQQIIHPVYNLVKRSEYVQVKATRCHQPLNKKTDNFARNPDIVGRISQRANFARTWLVC